MEQTILAPTKEVQNNNSALEAQNDHLVLISPPCLKLDFDKSEYPWHLKICVESPMNFWDCESLCEEFKIQGEIEKRLLEYFSSMCDVKQILVSQKDNQSIHHWYLSSDQIDLSVKDILKFDKLNSKRVINFELSRDDEWNKTIPILDRLKHKVLGLYSVLDQLNGYRD